MAPRPNGSDGSRSARRRGIAQSSWSRPTVVGEREVRRLLQTFATRSESVTGVSSSFADGSTAFRRPAVGPCSKDQTATARGGDWFKPWCTPRAISFGAMNRVTAYFRSTAPAPVYSGHSAREGDRFGNARDASSSCRAEVVNRASSNDDVLQWRTTHHTVTRSLPMRYLQFAHAARHRLQRPRPWRQAADGRRADRSATSDIECSGQRPS